MIGLNDLPMAIEGDRDRFALFELRNEVILQFGWELNPLLSLMEGCETGR